jgi:processive 1,2-diacylglycerol beta-glucosyltransferase
LQLPANPGSQHHGEPATTARQALLLSGSTGMGHDTLAEACATSLESAGWSTRTLDSMQLLGERSGAAGRAVFKAMLAVPGMYDAFHFAALRTGNWLSELVDGTARHQIVPRLRAELDARPVSLVISVYATAASAASSLASRYPSMRHLVFCTDATPHRMWVHPNIDLYLVTSAVAERAVRRFQPDARVMVVPAPVRSGFYDPPSQADARARLGVPEQERCVLLMSGLWGIGPLAEAAEALGNARLHVLAVAGNNTRLEGKLRAAARRQPRVRPFGFTRTIPELMAASDLVITSSGDTCTEARTVRRPLLLLDVVPGHGRDNLQHELEIGDAAVTSGAAAEVVSAALAALDQLKPLASGPARSRATWEAAFAAALATVGL